MSKGAFTDKQHPPKARDMTRVLGKARADWDEFVAFIGKTFGVDGEWKYYGVNHGWALRFRKGGKALVSLYPAERSFVAQVILSQSIVDRSRKMRFGKDVRAAIARAHPYPEGRWVFLTVDSGTAARQAADLLLLKSGLKPA